jgi:chorismate mutase
MSDERLFAVRGAIDVPRNDREAILASTRELVSAVMERNSLRPGQVVSCIFTCTDDLDAEFPAVAARDLGFDTVPLICAKEMSVPGAMPSIIRMLLHFYAERDHEPRPAYLGSARELRVDLEDSE